MNQKNKEAAAICSIPAYCLRTLGCRHIIVGGGGGSAKTGVPNELQLYLLGYNSHFDLKNGKFISSEKVAAQMNGTVGTDQFSNMNMDCISLTNEPEKGQYLIAVGQDKFCALYKTTGFNISESETSIDEHHLESPSKLAFNIHGLVRLRTDNYPGDDSYQECVRLFRSKNGSIKMITAGTDGYVRLWSVTDLLKSVHKQREHLDIELPVRHDFTPELEICSGRSAVEDIDISPDGTILATVLSNRAVLWDLANFGKQLNEIPSDTEGKTDGVLSKKFKVRSLRFICLNKSGADAIFVTAHNQRVRSKSSKEVSHLGLWVFIKNGQKSQMIKTNTACKESISCLEPSACGQFLAIGTMDGSVAFFDTQSLSRLLFIPQTHSSFVTAISFLTQRTYDIKDLGRIGERNIANLPAGRCFLPGICANSRATVVSISVDCTIQVHQLPYTVPNSFTAFLLHISLFISIFYIIFWAFFIRT